MNLFLLLFLLILSGLFSGSETAYFSLRPGELARMAGRRGGPRKVVALVEQPHNLLSALLIGNLVVNVAASVVATALCLSWFGEHGLAVAIPLATLTLLICGEITPKMLALRFRQRLAVLVRRPLSFWVWLCRPVLAVLAAGIDRLVSQLPWERTGTRPLKVAELETACDLAVQEGALSETEGRFLARLLQLQQLAVRQIMTPRPDVVTLDAAWSRDEILAAASRAGFNRYPVIAAEKPQPIGLLHLKDFLDRSAEAFPLRSGLRDLLFVPESKDVAALLAEMRTGGSHLAAVVDEHGDFTGIVTMADCLQALIGRVGDVSGPADPEVFRIDRDSWAVSGRLDLRELSEVCDVALPTSRDYVTAAGFVMAKLGRIPRPGDQVSYAGARFSVLQMSGHKVVRLQVDRPPRAREEGPS